MGIYSDLMGFYSDLMGYEWDVPSGNDCYITIEHGSVERNREFSHQTW